MLRLMAMENCSLAESKTRRGHVHAFECFKSAQLCQEQRFLIRKIRKYVTRRLKAQIICYMRSTRIRAFFPLLNTLSNECCRGNPTVQGAKSRVLGQGVTVVLEVQLA